MGPYNQLKKLKLNSGFPALSWLSHDYDEHLESVGTNERFFSLSHSLSLPLPPSLPSPLMYLQSSMHTSKTLMFGLLHISLIKNPNWIFTFAENFDQKRKQQHRQTGRNDLALVLLSLSLFFSSALPLPLRVQGIGGRKQTESWQLLSVRPLEPAFALSTA